MAPGGAVGGTKCIEHVLQERFHAADRLDNRRRLTTARLRGVVERVDDLCELVAVQPVDQVDLFGQPVQAGDHIVVGWHRVHFPVSQSPRRVPMIAANARATRISNVDSDTPYR